MDKPAFHTLDLHFLGNQTAIACYAIPHKNGVILVESGPGSTLTALEQGLAALGYRLDQVTDVLVTHIHLDHAGASGALARRGATVHVHPNGAPHLADPTKLLASAARIYGNQMEYLWGEFLPVPENQLNVLTDGQPLSIAEHSFLPLNTPGHANHHFAYLFQDTCFSGDIGGVRIPGARYLRVPMPPPEFNLPAWRGSVTKLRQAAPKQLAPTHFGPFDDVAWHLDELERSLDLIEAWLDELMPSDPELDEINRRFTSWMDQQAAAAGLPQPMRAAFEAANPSWMSASGMQRYWRKFRQG